MIFFFKFNQVIYSSSPISWQSFKPLAQILFEISCWKDFILIFSKYANFQRAITPEKWEEFFQNFNQVIYSSSLISWPSFKPLAQILFEISCWQDFVQIFSKGHNSRKGDNSDKKKIIFPWGIHIWNFKTLACTVHKIWHASDFIRIFSKGHNSRKGDNWDKKKNVYQIFFHEESIYEIYSMHGSCTDGWMDGQMHNPKPICPVNFFEVGGIIRAVPEQRSWPELCLANKTKMHLKPKKWTQNC